MLVTFQPLFKPQSIELVLRIAGILVTQLVAHPLLALVTVTLTY